MKKQTFFAAILAAICLVACGGKKGDNAFSLSGSLPAEVNAEWIYLYAVSDGDPVALDSARIRNGQFRFEGNAPDTVTMAVLHPGSIDEYPAVSWNLILEAGDMVADSNDEFVSGTPLNDGLKDWTVQVMTYMMGGDLEGVNQFFSDRWSEHSGDFVGSYIMMMVWPMLDFNFVDSLLQQVPQEVRDIYILKKNLFEPVQAKLDLQPGKMFKEVELSTLDDQPARLSDYLGKGDYVLVDFWASWCGPCRQSIPVLQDMIRKHKDVKVLGIAIRDKVSDTQKAIEQLNITWPVICDPKVATAGVYGFSSIPYMMLFAPDGTIVARDIAVDEDLDALFSNLKK